MRPASGRDAARMGFLRRGRRRPKGAKAPPEPAQQQSGSSTQPAVHRTSGAALPAGKASSSSKSTSTSSVTPTTGPALNKLPPGMPTMPETPPEYARLAERKVSDIDERFNSARRSLSFDSADSRGSKNRRRLRHVFGRSPRSRRSRSSACSTGSASNRRLSDVPVADGEASSVGLLSLAAGLACAPSDYDQAPHAPEEDPASRLKVSDLNTKGRLLLVEETMTEPVRVHDELVSFVVPHGWSATRTAWGFYLVCKDCLGFIMASSAQDATKHLIDTQKLSVLSDVHVMSSPLFESKHRAVVQYASLDLEGKGTIQYDVGFYPGATVLGLCGPRSKKENLRKVEERLAATAVVVTLPASFEEEKVKLARTNRRYEPSTMLGLSTGTNCVMQ